MLSMGRRSFWRNASPTGAMRDFMVVWRDNPNRWRVLAVSIVLSGLMFYGFIPKSERAPPERPKVSLISTFEAGRTDAQIIASNIENEKFKKQDAAERAARLERSKEQARALARASFMDPDELERQYADKPAASATPAPSGETVANRN
jgi:hypothetical protein